MKLTITEKDQARASEYYDNDNCLVATMLKHRGNKDVQVFGWNACIAGREFEIVNHDDIHSKFYRQGLQKVLKSAIGKKIELVEVV